MYNMRILLHICCAPCTIYPLKIFREERLEVTGCFYNPNIHPFREYRRRLETLENFAGEENLALMIHPEYEMEAFLRRVVYREEDRCRHCYEMRLRHTAAAAREGNYDGFSTTLLYSKYQKHELIRSVGEKMAEEYAVPFYYRDFRRGWEEGVRVSRERAMYRQPYCGCIYSEKERYAGKRPSG